MGLDYGKEGDNSISMRMQTPLEGQRSGGQRVKGSNRSVLKVYMANQVCFEDFCNDGNDVSDNDTDNCDDKMITMSTVIIRIIVVMTIELMMMMLMMKLMIVARKWYHIDSKNNRDSGLKVYIHQYCNDTQKWDHI